MVPPPCSTGEKRGVKSEALCDRESGGLWEFRGSRAFANGSQVFVLGLTTVELPVVDIAH